MNITIKQGAYKIGINEIAGLKDAMRELLTPVACALKERIYWTTPEITESEYLSRDGFIPHSHNHGGLELCEIIPACESLDWSFLEFGECDECGDTMCGFDGQECNAENEGHLDAKLRIWFKFEGIRDGAMHFYLYCGGGNGGAPYFRTKYEATLFEREFSAKSIAGLKRTAAKHITALLKVLE